MKPAGGRRRRPGHGITRGDGDDDGANVRTLPTCTAWSKGHTVLTHRSLTTGRGGRHYPHGVVKAFPRSHAAQGSKWRHCSLHPGSLTLESALLSTYYVVLHEDNGSSKGKEER